MARPVVHVEIRGLDAPGLQDFYTGVLGWFRDDDPSIGGYSVAEIGTGRLVSVRLCDRALLGGGGRTARRTPPRSPLLWRLP